MSVISDDCDFTSLEGDGRHSRRSRSLSHLSISPPPVAAYRRRRKSPPFLADREEYGILDENDHYSDNSDFSQQNSHNRRYHGVTFAKPATIIAASTNSNMVQKMARKSKKKNKDGGANSNYSRIYSSQQQQKLAENAAAAGVSKNTGGIVGGRQFDFRAKFSGKNFFSLKMYLFLKFFF